MTETRWRIRRREWYIGSASILVSDPMKLLRHSWFLVLLFLSLTSNAQNLDNCGLAIDEPAILADKNLDEFILRLKTDSFAVHTDKQEIPRRIIRQLTCLIDSNRPFIANPDERYQQYDVIVKKLPARQLIYLAKSKNILVLTYKTGGRASGRRILLIKFNKKGIVDLWTGRGEGSLDSNAEIIESIQRLRHQEWGLHSGVVYF